MAKEHIADYFENLYQAREGEKSHEEWTEHIHKTVDEIEKKARHPENQQPLTLDELTQCIRKLKRKKSTGPDTIPNEVFIEADKATREIYLEIMNKVYNEEKIPDEWHKGKNNQKYKGKGEKGKCSNERGISPQQVICGKYLKCSKMK